MNESIIYKFETISDDLPRPPLAAVRALMSAGILPKPQGWQSLDVNTRWEIAREGGRGMVDVVRVRELAQKIPPRYLRLVARRSEPNPDEVPASLVKALGPTRAIPVQSWRTLRAMDRSVLASLASNPRLLSKAYDELAERMGIEQLEVQNPMAGLVAHAEVQGARAAIDQLFSPTFLDGRALVLAKAAGLRVARRVHELLDLHAESAAGPVELDWATLEDGEGLVWQAHVSTWDGAPFPAAALLAVSAACTAVCDMIKDVDPTARISAVSLREEPWLVGVVGDGEEAEAATSLFSHDELLRASENSDARAMDAAIENGRTIRMDPRDFDFNNPGIEGLAGQAVSSATASADVVSSAPDIVPPPEYRGADSQRSGKMFGSAGQQMAVTAGQPQAEHGEPQVAPPSSHGSPNAWPSAGNGVSGGAAGSGEVDQAGAAGVTSGIPMGSSDLSAYVDDPVDLPVSSPFGGQRLMLVVLVGVAALMLIAALGILVYVFVL